jgi:hypothetical protein
MTEDIINAMKELIRCYEYANDPSNATLKEIEMWRSRFLTSVPRLGTIEKDAHMFCFFKALPSESMIMKEPEKHIEWIVGRINENQ